MPPKPALTSSFSVTDANNEVVCPLKNQDGSNCRKRCLGEKRFRSMQEHIRRAHPDHYIPKLPATEESFQLMINTPPSQRPQPAPTTAPNRRGPSDASDRDAYGADISAPPTPRFEEAYPAAANAAAALAQLHHQQHGSDWDSDVENYSEPELKSERPLHTIELPPLRDQHLLDGTRQRGLLPSILASSPPGRSSTLPPIHRDKIGRPRKVSVGQNARKGKHERNKSKDFARRLSIEGRKAMSAEPPTAAWAQGKRWEDLIEAATSATEAESDRDLTPIPHSPLYTPAVISTTASTNNRLSLPPGFRHSGHYQSYHASPLQKALTPPPPDHPILHDPEPFPTVESIESAGSGQNFHISRSGLPTSASTNEDSSPLQSLSQLATSQGYGPGGINIEIFCASCGRIWLLRDCYACTECICGVCGDCVNQIINSQTPVQPGYPPARRPCPKCGIIGGKWKKFQLDFR